MTCVGLTLSRYSGLALNCAEADLSRSSLPLVFQPCFASIRRRLNSTESPDLMFALTFTVHKPVLL